MREILSFSETDTDMKPSVYDHLCSGPLIREHRILLAYFDQQECEVNPIVLYPTLYKSEKHRLVLNIEPLTEFLLDLESLRKEKYKNKLYSLRKLGVLKAKRWDWHGARDIKSDLKFWRDRRFPRYKFIWSDHSDDNLRGHWFGRSKGAVKLQKAYHGQFVFEHDDKGKLIHSMAFRIPSKNSLAGRFILIYYTDSK